MEEIVLQTPARLHFGLLDLHGGLGRIDGGIGLALRTTQDSHFCYPQPELQGLLPDGTSL